MMLSNAILIKVEHEHKNLKQITRNLFKVGLFHILLGPLENSKNSYNAVIF